MSSFSKISLPPLEEGPQYDNIYNNTSTPSSSSDGQVPYPVAPALIFISLPCICTVGLVGNGIVICLLGFCIKKSPFTTFILNLAVADFGVLLFLGLNFISGLIDSESCIVYAFMGTVFMQNCSQLLLTAISIDRCGAVLFPIWHRCHRPPHLSTMVCAFIWVLSCLFSGSLVISYHFEDLDAFSIYSLIAVSVLCLPLVIASTTILLFRMFCKSQQPQRGRLLTIVLLTLLFFLIFALPLNAIVTVTYFTSVSDDRVIYGLLCASLNSCVNPVVYFVVGRKKRGQRRQSLKVMLQRAFQEEEEHREKQGTTAEKSL